MLCWLLGFGRVFVLACPTRINFVCKGREGGNDAMCLQPDPSQTTQTPSPTPRKPPKPSKNVLGDIVEPQLGYNSLAFGPNTAPNITTLTPGRPAERVYVINFRVPRAMRDISFGLCYVINFRAPGAMRIINEHCETWLGLKIGILQ